MEQGEHLEYHEESSDDGGMDDEPQNVMAEIRLPMIRPPNGENQPVEADHGHESNNNSIPDDASLSGSDSESDDANDEAHDEGRAQARDHAYLPGPSHPLLATTTSPSASNRDTQSQNTNINIDGDNTVEESLLELAILELPGVVLFPGCTIPIRLGNRSWIQHLGRAIDASRNVRPGRRPEQVRLGIVTHQHARRRSAMDQQQQEEEEDEEGNNLQRRRSSWLRRGVNARAQGQQRLSRILQQELLGIQDDDDFDVENDSDSEGDPRPRLQQQQQQQQRNRHPLMGRMGTIATITYTHGDAVLDDSRSNSSLNNSSSQVWQRHAEDEEELIVKAVGTSRFEIVKYLDFQSCADVQVFQVREWSHVDNRPLQLPPLHRTGMIAARMPVCWEDADGTLQYDELSAEEDGNQQHATPGSSSTTQQFLSHHARLVRHLSNVTPFPYNAYQHAWPWRLAGKLVQSLQTEEATNHALHHFEQEEEGDATTNNNDDTEQRRHHKRQKGLLPSLGKLLRGQEKSRSMAISPKASLMDDPPQFSFWMASNMPLSIDEKLDLLEVPSTVERLLLLQAKVQEYAEQACFVCCKGCHVPLTPVTDVFTVGGAEGTTGNYVNEHGYIHQVLTVRKVDDARVFIAGRASTENTYFPGYSWTVSYCRRCGSLLGWKFNWVGLPGKRNRRFSDNRPASFFGFMSSSVETHS